MISGLPGFLSIFLSFFSIPIFLNFLSADYYANFLIQHAILTLGMILNLNLGKFAAIKIQKFNLKIKQEIIFTSFMTSFVTGILLSTITYFIIISLFENRGFFDISFSLALGLFATILFISLEHIAKGLGYFKLSSFTNFLFYSLSLSLPAFLLLIDNEDLEVMNNLFIISLCIKYFALMYLIFILAIKNKLIFTKIYFKMFIDFKIHAKWMTINAFYSQIYDYVDKYLIKIYLGSTMLIAYAVPQQIAAKLTIFSQAIISVFLPKISSIKTIKGKKEILSSNIYFYLIFVGGTLILLLPFYNNILSWWLKDSYNLEILKIFKLFILLTFLGSLSNIINAFYEATLIAKKNTIYETKNIVPFCIGLLICVYYQNIFYFAFLILFKEFIMLFVRLRSVKKYILYFDILNFIIFILFLAYIFSFFNLFYFSYFMSFLFILILLTKFPLKILLKNYF